MFKAVCRANLRTVCNNVVWKRSMTEISVHKNDTSITPSQSGMLRQINNDQTTQISSPITYNNTQNTPSFQPGDTVRVTIVKLNQMGAVVDVETGIRAHKKVPGLILADDVDLFTEKLNGELVTVGHRYDAFVSKVKDDGKLLISFRPPGIKRIKDVEEQVLNAVKQSPTGILPVGDRSAISDIGLMFRGVSKHDFKVAVGRLYKAGLVKPGAHSIALMGAADQKEPEVHPLAHLEKTHLLPVKPGNTMFIGNLPLELNDFQLLAGIEEEIGFQTVGSLRLVRNELTGASRRYAFVDFKNERDVDYAIRKFKRNGLFDCKVRVSRSSKRVAAIKVPADTPGAYPIVRPVEAKSPDGASAAVTDSVALPSGRLPDLPQLSTAGAYDISDLPLLQSKKAQLAAAGSKVQQYSGGSDDQLQQSHHQLSHQSSSTSSRSSKHTSGNNSSAPLPSEDEADEDAFDVDPDFDPETEYYVFDDNDEHDEYNDQDDQSGGGLSDKVRSGSPRKVSALAGEQQTEEKEAEPEDYNDVKLYRSRGGGRR